jgi:malate synthase
VLGDRPNQLDRRRDDVEVTPAELLDVRSAPGSNTEQGLRNNLEVAVAYTAVWLSGSGAVAIHNLMEDAATAEISRSQIWQQIRNEVKLADTGEVVTAELVSRLLDEETEGLRAQVDPAQFERYYRPAKELIADLCLADEFTDFLTLPAYELVK